MKKNRTEKHKEAEEINDDDRSDRSKTKMKKNQTENYKEDEEIIDDVSDETTSSTSSGFNQGNKRKRISMEWKYFKKSSDKKIAKCMTCGKEYKTSGNTSNLADHIKRFHSLVNKIDSEEVSIQSSSASSNSGQSSIRSRYRSISPIFKRSLHYESLSQRKKELDEALVMMIATDLQPFNIVNDVGFKKFIHLLDPKYVLPSKFTIRTNLMKNVYLQGFNKLKQILSDINYMAITTDCWTSVTTESYLSVTCHFINTNYELKATVLSTKCLTKNHTAQNMADALLEVFEEWNIDNKITCIVTDNAANMIKMCEILKKRHLSCYAHTLNLVVQDNLNLDCIKNVISKCKEIVRFIKSNQNNIIRPNWLYKLKALLQRFDH